MTRTGIAALCLKYAFFLLCSLVWLTGCAGKGAGGGLDQAALTLPPLSELDALPRHSAMLDNDTLNGDQYLAKFDGVDDPPLVKLEGGATPGSDFAYAVYQIPARPSPAVPAMLTVTSYYSDPDPLTMDPAEGYYIAYGEFNTDGWVVSGPYYKTVARVPFDPALNVTSPGGNIYAAAIALDGTVAMVAWVQVGYDAGVGYEEHLLAPAQGKVAGRGCHIAADPDGHPQIAYIRAESMLFDDVGRVYVARRDGSVWKTEEVGTPYPARVVQLALGSGGRRALLLEDPDLHEFHLLWDGTGGGFSNDIPVDPADMDAVTPSLAFCNSGDSGAGELDTAMVVYAVPDLAPNVKFRFLRYDGGAPLNGDLFGPTRQIGAIDLYTDANRQVRAAFPIAPAYPVWDLAFRVYSAALNAWASWPPDWTGVDIGTDTDELIVRACQTGAGEFAAAYVLDEFTGLRSGLSAGGPFGSKPEDTHYCALYEEDFELQAFSDGTVAHLVQAGNYTLGMYRGRPDSGMAWDYIQVSTEPLGCSRASFAVDAYDTAHFAVLNPLSGRLEYYMIDAFGEREQAVVDTGGGDPGLAFGPAPVATVGDDLYVFYADSARMRILYSRCSAGAWQEEGVPLNAPEALPYILMGAGYLEDEDLLYVVYLDFYDMNAGVLSCPPGENNWHREEFGLSYFGLSAVADDEHEVGIVHAMENPIMDSAIFFSKGDPRLGAAQPETITTAVSNIDNPWYLDYSPADGCWGLLVNDEDNERVTYYKRGSNGIWGAPQVVAATSGVGAFVAGAGLVHSTEDGTARVVIHEGPVGPFAFQINVYRELAGGGFAAEGNVCAIDAAALDSRLSCVIESQEGLPFVVVQTQAPMDHWYFKTFAPDGLGGWMSTAAWNSQIHDLMGEEIGLSGGLDPAGWPVLTAAEIDRDQDMFGWVFVYHRW